MIMNGMPPEGEMYRALLDRDSGYDGLFFVGVKTTGIFCRPTCPARKPKPGNVEYFRSAGDAVASGYRACLRCRPLEMGGRPPQEIRVLLAEVERDPARRWTDADLRSRSLHPASVRRWFRKRYGMTFHAWVRAHRLGGALERIGRGADLTDAAWEAGYESPSGFRDAFGRLFGTTPGRSRETTVVHVTRIATPLGQMLAGATADGVCLLEFADRRGLEAQLHRLGRLLNARPAPGANDPLRRLEVELAAYFDGGAEGFTVSLVLPGTEFQRAVWSRLLEIPRGETLSYAALAREVGRPGAQRAVGRANGSNRVAILVPCHRVIRRDGALSGYGGGVWRKRALLDLESARSS